jgi:hypothetical protein
MTAARLLTTLHTHIGGAMRTLPAVLALLVACCVTAPVLAQPKPAKPSHPAPARTNPPKAIGKFDDWEAATHVEAGQTVCYAFTYAQTSAPAVPGRDKVVLTVTQRQSGRDAVAISAGFSYAANAAVAVQVDQATLDFYTAQRSAFARDGHGAVLAFEKARSAVAVSPAPHNVQVTDTFSLKGFTAAYGAINKACPAK